MAEKAKNEIVTGRFSIKQADYLDELVEKGYGTNRVEVVEYLVQRSFDDLIRSGVLQR